MIASGEKAIGFCQRPKTGINIVLAFGEDIGIVSDAIDTLITKWRKHENGDLDIIRLQEDDLKKDAALLVEHLTAVSLLGGKQLFRLRITNETLAKQLISLVQDIATGQVYPENYFVIESVDLKKNSKIREAFSSSPDTVCLQFFAEDQDQTAEYIRRQFSDLQVTIDTDALELFAAELPGDRRMANAEIEKVALYAFEIGRPLTVEDMHSICASEQPLGADDTADAALAGDIVRANRSLDSFLDAGGSSISALRTLHYRLLRVLDARAGARFLRPPVFERDKAEFNKAIKDWDVARVNRALSVLYAAEKTCKQGGVSTEAILKIVIDRISRRQI